MITRRKKAKRKSAEPDDFDSPRPRKAKAAKRRTVVKRSAAKPSKRTTVTKRKAGRTGAPKRKKGGGSPRPGMRRGALAVTVPVPDVRVDSPELGALTSDQRLELAALGTKRRGNWSPTWIPVDGEDTWRKALRTVAPYWRRFQTPYAVVVFVYSRLGGHVQAAGRPQAHDARQLDNAPRRGAAPRRASSGRGGGYDPDELARLHAEIRRTGPVKDEDLEVSYPGLVQYMDQLAREGKIRVMHPSDRYGEWTEYMLPLAPKRGAAGASGVQVAPVQLDDLGYDEQGTYQGDKGSPLWRVFGAGVDSVVRAATAAAARALVTGRAGL